MPEEAGRLTVDNSLLYTLDMRAPLVHISIKESELSVASLLVDRDVLNSLIAE